MKFIDKTFPIILVVGEARQGEDELRQLREGWERFFVRGALTAITWVWKPAFPQKAVATLDDAVAYCVERLAAADVPLEQSVPEVLATLRRETRE